MKDCILSSFHSSCCNICCISDMSVARESSEAKLELPELAENVQSYASKLEVASVTKAWYVFTYGTVKNIGNSNLLLLGVTFMNVLLSPQANTFLSMSCSLENVDNFYPLMVTS